MKRDPSLVPLSREHHDGLAMARRLRRETPTADDAQVSRLCSDVCAFWDARLQAHFRAEVECLLVRLVRHLPAEHEAIAKTNADHVRIGGLVTTIIETSDPGERREAVRRFGEALRSHIHWEEQVLFEIAQQRLKRDEMAAVGKELAERLPDAAVPFGRASRSMNVADAD
jgi:hypothetical protein